MTFVSNNNSNEREIGQSKVGKRRCSGEDGMK